MKKPLFTGSGVAIITPMFADGSINYEVFGQLIEFQIAQQTDSIVVCGTTGEASVLNDEEHLAAIAYCVKQVNGRVPVIAGTGSNDTRHAVELSKEAAQRGANGLLQVTPYYNKTNQSGLINHFTTIAEAAGLPVILYNVPSRTGMTIKPETYKVLAEHPLFVGTKEATGDIAHIANVAALCGDDMPLYSGNDDQALPIMALGGLGVISVVANIMPKEIHNLCASFLAGDLAAARKAQLDILPLNNALFSDVNPIPVKEALNLMGYNAGPCRAPLGGLDDAAKQALTVQLQNYKLL